MSAKASQVSTEISTESGSEPLRYDFSLVPGYFQQDEARGRDNQKLGTVFNFPENFGLISQPYDTDESLVSTISHPTDWQRFDHKLRQLNHEGLEHNTQYVLLYAARHGQGFHNIGEEKIGTEIWHYPSSLTPTPFRLLPQFRDASLTPVGEDQATTISSTFKNLITNQDLPPPTAYFCSPLRRACQTAELTWKPLHSPVTTCEAPKSGPLLSRPFSPIILNLLREQMYHANCNQRSPLSQIRISFPDFTIIHPTSTPTPTSTTSPSSASQPYNPTSFSSFPPNENTEFDPDWSPTTNESDFSVIIRAHLALSQIISSLQLFPSSSSSSLHPSSSFISSPTTTNNASPPKPPQYISLTTHAGFLSGLYRSLSREYQSDPSAIPRLPTGIVVPLLVKVKVVRTDGNTGTGTGGDIQVDQSNNKTVNSNDKSFTPNLPRVRPMAREFEGKDLEAILTELFDRGRYGVVKREMETGRWS